MDVSYRLVGFVGVMGLVLAMGSGCSKSIDAGSGSKEFEQGAKQGDAKREQPQQQQAQPQQEQPQQAQQQEAQPQQAQPPEQPQQAQGGSGSEPLKGFESVDKGKDPQEERLGSGGTMVAKGDTSDAAERSKEQQAAGTETGLMDVFFAYDSWKLSDEGKHVLARDAEWLKSNPKQKLIVEGHCDERGTQAYNLVLGEKRAKAARGYLVELGVKGDRLAVRSYGKEKPFCKEQGESCYQQNRRAHVVLRGQ